MLKHTQAQGDDMSASRGDLGTQREKETIKVIKKMFWQKSVRGESSGGPIHRDHNISASRMYTFYGDSINNLVHSI